MAPDAAYGWTVGSAIVRPAGGFEPSRVVRLGREWGAASPTAGAPGSMQQWTSDLGVNECLAGQAIAVSSAHR